MYVIDFCKLWIAICLDRNQVERLLVLSNSFTRLTRFSTQLRCIHKRTDMCNVVAWGNEAKLVSVYKPQLSLLAGWMS